MGEIVRQHLVFTNFALWKMYNLLMIVYGELLFIENMIIGGILLYLTGEICGYNRRRSFESSRYLGKFRFAAGSMMCGAFSLAIFLDAKVPFMILMEAVFAVVVCEVVFGNKGHGHKRNRSLRQLRRLKLPWSHVITFILVTYFMGGIVMGILLVTQQQGMYTAVGIYTGDMKAAALALFICLGYMTMKQIIKTVRNRKLYTEHTYEAEIIIGEHIIKASAFLDTGNRLKDPMTGKSVAVASEQFWKVLMEVPVACLDIRYALVPYESLGAKGFIRAVRTDRVDIVSVNSETGSVNKINGCLIARSNKEILNGYDLLISGEMIE